MKRLKINVKNIGKKLAFTLVEVLPPVGLAGLLVALGLPALNKAKAKGMLTKSINNQRQIGLAYVSYLGDNHGWYPEVRGIAGVGGKKGQFVEMVKQKNLKNLPKDARAGIRKQLEKLTPLAGNNPELVARTYGAPTPPNERPLNQYIDDLNVFHDPADKGGTAFQLKSCWEAFGNSYQPALADDFFRVRHVLGERTEDNGTPFKGDPENYTPSAPSEHDDPPEGRSMHESEIRRPDNKIVQGDWNWPYDKDDAWHAKNGEAGHVMLYGDGHSEYYVFPPTSIMMLWLKPPPNDKAFRAQLDNPDPRFAADIKKLNLNPAQYKTINGRPARYIDPDFLWW